MNSVEFQNNDIYFMEILEEMIVINDNYRGLFVLNSRFKKICEIELFEGLTIYSSFKYKSKLLLFCSENNCLVYVDLNLMQNKIIPLSGFENWIFSPLYIWNQNAVVLSDYKGNVVRVDLENCRIHIPDTQDVMYRSIKADNEKWKGYQIHKIYREKKKAILIEQNQIVKLVDYSHDMRIIGEFKKGEFYDFEWENGYFTMVSENKVILVHDGKSTSFKPEQSYNFFRGKIMSKKKDVLFLLSAMKSHLNNSKIQKIELAK